MRFSHWRDLPCFGSGSHQLAEHAFKDEIIGVEIETPEGKQIHLVDEGIRFDATLEGIAGVKLLSPDGAMVAYTATLPNRLGTVVMVQTTAQAVPRGSSAQT